MSMYTVPVDINAPECGTVFTVMHSGFPYDGDHRCIEEWLHEGPHKDIIGFVWGMVDQRDDPWHQKLLEYDRWVAEKKRKKEEKRAKANRRWYRKLARRVR